MKRYIPLGDVISKASVDRCGTAPLPILSITMKDGLVLQDEKFKKRIASVDTSDYKVIPRGKLVQGIHIDEANFGIQDIVDAGIVSPAYKVWDVKSEIIFPKYLEMIMRSPRSLAFYKSKLNGSVNRRGRMTDDDFLGMEIPFVEYSEQQGIVGIINRTKVIIKQREAQLSALDDLIKARFVEMFGDPHRSKNYPYFKVSGLTDVVSGGTPDRKNVDCWNNGTIPWVKTTELQNKTITKAEEYITEKGLSESSAKVVPASTVLIAMYGQGKTRGMTGFLGIDACTNQACACLLPTSNIDMQYLWYFLILSYDELRGLAQGGNQPNLNAGMIKDFPILVPPMEEQKQIVSCVSQIDKSKSAIQKSLEETQLLYDSLMQEYFG